MILRKSDHTYFMENYCYTIYIEREKNFNEGTTVCSLTRYAHSLSITFHSKATTMLKMQVIQNLLAMMLEYTHTSYGFVKHVCLYL